MAPVLVLIGSPGAGKTSVGRRVAQRLELPFADSDHLIEESAGASVSDIFLNQGEDAFRAIEADIVGSALAEFDGVLALGGGAVMQAETQERLAGHRAGGHRIVWLRVSVADAARRVGLNTARPLLLGNVRGTLSTLLDQRTPVYDSVSTDVVDTSGRSVRQVVNDVVRLVSHE